jgi:hypothetical protein
MGLPTTSSASHEAGIDDGLSRPPANSPSSPSATCRSATRPTIPSPETALRDHVHVTPDGVGVIVSVDTEYAAKQEFDLRLEASARRRRPVPAASSRRDHAAAGRDRRQRCRGPVRCRPATEGSLMARLLTALRDQLVTAGIVRDPSVAGSLPPFWRDPKLGTPAPGEGNNPTRSAPTPSSPRYLVGGIAPQPLRLLVAMADRRTSVPDQQGVLGRRPGACHQRPAPDRRDFMLGGSSGLYVVECQQNLPLQRLSSDEQGWEHLTQYVFQTYRPGYTGIH